MSGMSRLTRYHLAVVDGPDTGWVAGLPEGVEVVVGRGEDADLDLDDPWLSRRHLMVRDRRGRLAVRAAGRAQRVTVRRGRRRRSGLVRLGRRRRVRRRWRTVTPGSRIAVGRTVVELREHPGLATPRAAPAAVLTDGLGMRLLVPLATGASMVPLALTSGAGSPWRAVTWLVLPLVLIVAVLWPWLRERAARRGQPAAPERPAPPPPDPAGLLPLAEHAWRGAATDWDLGSENEGRRRRVRREPPPEPGHGIAVVGSPQACRAMARWLVCQTAHRTPPESLTITLPPSWDWAEPLPHTQPGRDDRAALVVIEVFGHDRATRLPAGAVGILLAASLADVPAWCTEVVEAAEDHDRRVGPAWAHEIALTLAGAARSAAALPTLVTIDDLGGTRPEHVLESWRTGHRGLVAPLGVDESGPYSLDLAVAGPHALVAGTTGSGKSELLTTWVLGLALRYPPAALHVLLVDYKGGATFGALAALPHVVDVLTDLDTGTTARALASLRAELATRERRLAAEGARSLAELTQRGGSMPRLLVVVDEFRTLADAHPELLDGLVRLAAQGRSLGIHLVLATQRPGGAVTADMRANISVRLCLRVLEQVDSLDMVGDDAAARLPAIPGRAVVRTKGSTTIQVGWPGTVDDGVARVVASVRTAAGRAAEDDSRLVTVTPPWAPPLPHTVPASGVPGGRPGAVPLLLVDLPEQQRLDGWHLPVGETLLVSGPPGSGRTTAARTVATEAVRAGVVTHTIGSEPMMPAAAPAAGTSCTPDDVRRAVTLLRALERGLPGQLLVVDDVEQLCRSLEVVLGFGAGTETLLELLRSARRRGLGIVLTASPPATRWAAACRSHLVLAPRDVSDALVSGIPRELVPLRAPPGRGVLLTDRTAAVGHVAVADPGGPWAAPSHPPLRILPLPTVVDLAPEAALPGAVLVGLGGDDGRPVGASLRDGGVWLVLGGAGTGRSTALSALATRLRADGRPVWTDPAEATGEPGGVLVVDDAERLPPALAAATGAAVQRGVALLAAARPEPLAASFSDLARRLRDPDVVLVLGSPAGTAPWAGADLRPLADPDPRPGRGLLVARGTAVAVQVDRCSAATG